MTDVRVHDPVRGECTTWAPLAARGPVWPRAGVWFYRALTQKVRVLSIFRAVPHTGTGEPTNSGVRLVRLRIGTDEHER
jgi:hypothetical protein